MLAATNDYTVDDIVENDEVAIKQSDVVIDKN